MIVIIARRYDPPPHAPPAVARNDVRAFRQIAEAAFDVCYEFFLR
jgi:hypothetical protein